MEDNSSSGAGLIGSIVLHAGIIIGALITFQHAHIDLLAESPPVVPVDLVTIAQKTNIAPETTFKPKIEQEQIQPQKPDLVTPKLPPIEQAEPAPETAPSEPVLPKPRPEPKPQAKPQHMVEQPQKKKPAAESVDALVNKLLSQTTAPTKAKLASRNIRGYGLESAMTMDLSDALSEQIGKCWSPPIGAPRAEELVVDFDLFLTQDGRVAQPPQLTASSRDAAASDPYTRASADAARRAIYECQPYKLPADRYSQWQEINPFHFDPSRMMGQ